MPVTFSWPLLSESAGEPLDSAATVRGFRSPLATETTDFGSDVSTFPRLDPAMAPLTGPPVLAEVAARRLSTRRGSMPFLPNDGMDIREWLSEELTDEDLDNIKADAENELEKDERILSAQAVVELTEQTETLRISLQLETSDGPFRLVLGIDALSVAILSLES